MDDDGQIAEGLAFHKILLDNGIKIIETMAAMPVNQETEKTDSVENRKTGSTNICPEMQKRKIKCPVW